MNTDITKAEDKTDHMVDWLLLLPSTFVVDNGDGDDDEMAADKDATIGAGTPLLVDNERKLLTG